MWGTSLPEDKLAGDLGNVIEATSIGGRRSDFFTAGKLALGNLGLLQQYRHEVYVPPRRPYDCYRMSSELDAHVLLWAVHDDPKLT